LKGGNHIREDSQQEVMTVVVQRSNKLVAHSSFKEKHIRNGKLTRESCWHATMHSKLMGHSER
jgi:hypothetical protein